MKEESSFREKLSQILDDSYGTLFSKRHENKAHKAIIDLVESVIPKDCKGCGFPMLQCVGFNQCREEILTKIKL